MLNKLITPTISIQTFIKSIKFDKETLKSMGKVAMIVAGIFTVVFISLNSIEHRHDSYTKSGKYLSVGGTYEPLPTELRWNDSF